MKYLAIDTSGNNLTVIVNGEREEIYFDPDCKINHSTALMPEIENSLIKAGVTLKDLDFIACVVGAGSFTGIRIGVSTAKALCFANRKPCLKITSFDTIAYNKKSGKVLAIIDAGHGGYYVAGYSDGKEVLSPEYIDFEKLNLLAKEYKLLAGAPVKGVAAEVVSLSFGLKAAVENKKNEITCDIEALTPLYIRKSQAEEDR